MTSKSRFYALEVMCRERARLADKESNHWLAEAEEWARLRQSCKQWVRSSSEPSRFEEKNEPLSALPGRLRRNLLWRAKLAAEPRRSPWQLQRINLIAFPAAKRPGPFAVYRHHQHNRGATVFTPLK
jgi:hypothetical protein